LPGAIFRLKKMLALAITNLNHLMKKILAALLFALIPFMAIAQSPEPQLYIVLIDQNDLSDVNVDDSEAFAKGLSPVIDLLQQEFKDIPATQAVGVKVTLHKTGAPTYSFYSKPAIAKKREADFMAKAKKLTLPNTKLVDFNLFVALNSEDGKHEEFFGFKSPTDERLEAYAAASLKEQVELNKKWAIEEVLPVLAAYGYRVDEKYAGVKGIGTQVAATNFGQPQDIDKLTGNNSLYWRAVMEMEPGNQLIPVTKIFSMVSQGEFDYAGQFGTLINIFSDEKTVTDAYIREWVWRKEQFNKKLEAEINKGIVLHDKGKYAEAIAVYKNVLKLYPASAWARYEIYFSQNALDLEKGKYEKDDRKLWDESKAAIYKLNPLYDMDVRASNGREAWLIERRMALQGVFKDSKNRLAEVYEYADIALDLGAVDFAAQFFWLTYTYGKDDFKKKSLARYLYCLEKLGVTQWKSQFEGDWPKAFADIDKEKDEAMKNSTMYKSMKN
jgi:TPR repeat